MADPTDSPDPVPSPQAMRIALGRFATSVTIITCADAQGRWTGLTVNSFAALSLAPPLVLWSLRLASPSLAAFRAARHFAVNVLADTQVEMSRRFASPQDDKFGAGHWTAGQGGAPVLSGCSAVFECEVQAQHEAGDHWLFIGQVLRVDDQGVAPLLFQAGHYHLLGEIL